MEVHSTGRKVCFGVWVTGPYLVHARTLGSACLPPEHDGRALNLQVLRPYSIVRMMVRSAVMHAQTL
jgi:hypothetical protein